MFDDALPGPAQLADLDDAELVAAVADWARASAAGEARKLAAIAELMRRRTENPVHPKWVCDDWDAVAAEISCALTIGHGRAIGQIDLAVMLRDRLPKVGARFLAGDIDGRTVSTIGRRTQLVRDEQVWVRLDALLAERATDWGALSQYKLEHLIDACVDEVDPEAVRRTRDGVRGRSFTVGSRDDTTGTTSVHGRLSVADAALLEQRLISMIKGVCEDDPRTMGNLRADAVGAIAAGATRLQCRCDNPDCVAGAEDDGRASSVVVHVIADASSLDEPRDPLLDGMGPAPADPEPTVPGPPDQPVAPPARRRKPALIPGARGGIVPAPLLAELIAHGAKVRFLADPAVDPEKRYRPSTALDEFVRTRDLTCRWPGCDRPAVHADIDHTAPWPAGVTHPGNLKCYCRIHHLVKTFWDGWTETQQPDGTLVLTGPAGHTYRTKPFSQLLFPSWAYTTPPPPSANTPTSPTGTGRGLMMPTRRTTRAKAREYRINAERALNAVELAREAAKPKPIRITKPSERAAPYQFHPAGHEPDYGDDPPPF